MNNIGKCKCDYCGYIQSVKFGSSCPSCKKGCMREFLQSTESSKKKTDGSFIITG